MKVNEFQWLWYSGMLTPGSYFYISLTRHTLQKAGFSSGIKNLITKKKKLGEALAHIHIS